MESYKIAYGEKPSELQMMVNLLIQEGYLPIGGITDLGYLSESFTDCKHKKFLVQPMIIKSYAIIEQGVKNCSHSQE